MHDSSILTNSVAKLKDFQSWTANNHHEYFSWFMSTFVVCDDTLFKWVSASGLYNIL